MPKSRVDALAKMAGRKTARSAVEVLCRKLVRDSGQRTPPVDVNQYAKCRNTEIKEEPNLATTGVLERNGDHFIIRVRADMAHGRKRFTICHELVHTFFEDASWQYRLTTRGLNQYSDTEEKMCGLGAAELLFPRSALRKVLKAKSTDLNLVRAIAKEFESSISAAAFRILDLTDSPFAVVRWYATGLPGARSLRPHFAAKGIPKSLFSGPPLAVREAYESRVQTATEFPFIIGGKERRGLCESFPLKGSRTSTDSLPRQPVVLSIIHIQT